MQMSEEDKREKPVEFEEEGGQHGGNRSIARGDALKHIRKQHPQRDIPKVDTEEPPGPEK
jgi:hypothetical protein